MIIGGYGGYGSEDVGLVQLGSLEESEELAAYFGVGHQGKAGGESRNVKRLGGCLKGDAALPSGL